jgi:uncharacterized membrane protein
MEFLDFMQGVLQTAVKQTSLSPLAVKAIGVALLLLFLLYAVRNPGKSLKLFVVISIFVILSYVAYAVIQLGVQRSQEIEKNRPDLTP